MIALFLILFFGGMLLLGLPMVGSIFIASASIPLLGHGDLLTWLTIAQSAIDNAVSGNTGLTIVLFMIAGEFMAKGGLTEKIFDTFSYFLGKRKGFMPIISIATCMFYGAISGSGPATTAAVGAMCYPLLIQMGYSKLFSASILVSAGCLGMVIPPSVPLTGAAQLAGGLDLVALYQIAAVAGVAAGLLLMIYAYLHCVRTGDGNQVMINAAVDELRKQSFGAVLKDSIWALLTPVIILGTIFSGIADTAQAAVISLVYSILVAVYVYKTIKPAEIIPTLRRCAFNACPLCFMIAMAAVFTAGMNALQIPTLMANAMIATGMSGTVMMIMVLAAMLILGAFMDAGAAMTILVPLFCPVLSVYGVNLYTGVVAIIMCQAVGLCNPFCGLCNLVMAPIAGVTIGELGMKVLKLSALLVLVAVIIALFPALTSWAWTGMYMP
ncbi:MAG: TRAP transporter large permease subunit [Lachnospiraceae bacterium]|nr:TRAP transporter large permease subunit [Lachnospiraceae bacterium]